MRRVLLVAEREIVDKKVVFAAALGAGVVALAAPLLPGVIRGSAVDARNTMALVFAATFALAVALLYGASCIARDLRERRLSFYFSRPLPAASLWAGKLLGGVVLALGSAALALVPAVLVSGPGFLAWIAEPSGALVLAHVVALIALSHALAVMLSSRTRWLALDFTALVVLGGATAALLRALLLTGSEKVLGWAIAALAVATLVALLAAGLVQVVVGRTDAQRGHRALSLMLWAVLAAATAALAGYTWFLLHPSVRSLTYSSSVHTEGRSGAVAVSGTSAGRGDCLATFVVDAVTGSATRLTVAAGWPQVVFAGDGSLATWPEPFGVSRSSGTQLMTLDLSRAGARPAETPILLPPDALLALSADGRLVAAAAGSIVSIHELATGRLLTSARLPAQGQTRLTFAPDGRLRVEVHGKALVVAALDPAAGRLVETGRLDLNDDQIFVLRLGSAGRTMLVGEDRVGGRLLVLRDAWTTREVATLDAAPPPGLAGRYAWLTTATVLDDGRVAVGEAGSGGARLHVFSAAGVPCGAVDLGPATRINVGSEVAPGRVAVTLGTGDPRRPSASGDWRACEAVDLATGARTPIGQGLRPMLWLDGYRAMPAGGVGARLFTTSNGGTAVWDPERGLHPLIPR
jgi:hypothetical protein